MQKTVLIALAVVGTLTASYFLLRPQPVQPQPTDALKGVYNQWKLNYKINVGAAEDDYRFKVFSNNYAKIQTVNKQNKSYTLGLNSFTHLTQEEFSSTRLGLKVPKTLMRNTTKLPLKNLKATVDWRGKLNTVKDQGQCGSCWAFSAVGALEGLHSVKGAKLHNLAEQELVDCSTSYGNNGCNGGLMDYAFQYVIDNKGISTGAEYPYTAADGSCAAKSKTAPISSFTDVTPNDPAALKAAIDQQPVAVAIEADTFTFQGYTGGVINDDSCGTNLDHGVVAVGYNADDATPYYIVRNSWGTGWGIEGGHVRIGIQSGAGICGIQSMSSFPNL